MSRLARRRLSVGLTVVGLTLVSGISLPSTSARFNADTQNGPSSFSAGVFPDPGELLAELVMGALCGTVEEVPVCPEAAAPSAAQDEASPQFSVEPDATVTPGMTIPGAKPRRSTPPTPAGDDETPCEQPDCPDEPLQIVDAFAKQLTQQHARNPRDVPAEATKSIERFARDLRESATRPADDLLLPDDTRLALEELARAGVLDAFTPECMTTLGQMASLVAPTLAEPPQAGSNPSPSPSPTTTPQPRTSECPESSGSAGTPSPSPSPSPTANPSPSPSPGPPGSERPENADYPYDPPGVRQR